MKKLFFILMSFIATTSLRAQTDKTEGAGTSRSVYAEIGGAGIGFSANFDSRFMGSKGFGFRVGLGVIPLNGNTILTIPLGLNYLAGRGPSYFEAEVTGTLFTSTSGKFNGKALSSVFIFPHVGYRYTKPSKSFLGRICAGPMFFGSAVEPFAGISLGYTL